MTPDRLARRHFFAAALWVSSLLALGGCKQDEPPSAPPEAPSAPAPPAPAPAPAKEDKLVVFAAASLRDVFTTLGDGFKAAHADLTLTFNFAGTQELRTQLEQGAAVDVFASADQKHMGELVKAGRAAEPTVFARNEPVMVVAKEKADKLRELSDLPKAARIVIGVPEVPIGRYTLQILDQASVKLGADFRKKVEAKVVSRELNVRQVLTKVSLGEADAGIVYRSDAQTALDKLSVVTIPPELNVIAEYPIAAVLGAAHPELARAFIALVRSPEGQVALQSAGFLAPGGGSTP